MLYDWHYYFGLEISPGSLTNVISSVERLSYDVALADTFRPLQVDQLLADFYSAGSLSPLKSSVGPGRRVSLKVQSDPAAQSRNYPNGCVVASWVAGYGAISGSPLTVSFKLRFDAGSHTDQYAQAVTLPFDEGGDPILLMQPAAWNVNTPIGIQRRTFPAFGFTINANSFFGYSHEIAYVAVASHQELYWNGVQVDSRAATGGITVPTSGGAPFAMAGCLDTPQQVMLGGFGGRLRDVRVWSRALDNAEVLYHYLNPDALDTDGRSLLLGQWKFDEGSGANVRDYSTTANTAVFRTNSSNQTPSSWAAMNPNYPLPGIALFTGRVVDAVYDPALNGRTLHIEAMTDLDRMQAVSLTTSLFANYNAASLCTEILTRSNLASFDVSSLQDVAQFAWYRSRDAFNALDELLQSGDYRAYVDGAGTVHVQNRYWSVFDSAVASYSTANNSLAPLDLKYEINRANIINESNVTGERRRAATSVGTIAFINQPISIPASSAIGVWMGYIDPAEPSIPAPATGVVVPVQSSDWYLATNSDGSGTERTSTASIQFTAFGETAVCSIFNGSGLPVWLTKFQIRGTSVQRRSPASGFSDNSSSQSVYGKRTKNIDNALFGDDSFLKDLATFLVEGHREPQGTVRMSLSNVFPDVHLRQVGQSVSVVDGVSGINSNWFVRGASHDISMVNGIEHRVSYELEYFQRQDWLVLDHAVFGKLDSRRLGL